MTPAPPRDDNLWAGSSSRGIWREIWRRGNDLPRDLQRISTDLARKFGLHDGVAEGGRESGGSPWPAAWQIPP